MTVHDVARRAVHLQAIGLERQALTLLEPGFTDAEIGLELATGMATVLIADPDHRQSFMVELPPEHAHLIGPVVAEVVTLTRGDHLGGLHQIWHRLDRNVRLDVLATLLAITGQTIRHPERN